MAEEGYLYEDKFVGVDSKNLLIKDFDVMVKRGVPNKVKILPIVNICAIYYEKHCHKHLIKTKIHGLSINSCWWAFDAGRHNPTIGSFTKNNKYNVVLHDGTDLYLGFSIERMDEFLAAIQPLLRKEVPVHDGFPF